jgi:hypothetical protein
LEILVEDYFLEDDVVSLFDFPDDEFHVGVVFDFPPNLGDLFDLSSFNRI